MNLFTSEVIKKMYMWIILILLMLVYLNCPQEFSDLEWDLLNIVFISPELKAQVSYSDRRLSVVSQ
jgi:hypothetical protein